jgi:thiamine-phosphate pyrophosphorylase
MTETIPNRCRIVLIARAADPGATPDRVLSALEGGDAASIILVGETSDVDTFQQWCEEIAPDAQTRGVAVIIAGDTRVAGRIGADGIHLDAAPMDVAEMVKRHDGKMIVGAYGGKTRDEALDIGEAQPDYMFFGRFGFDDKPEAHPRNLALAQWWAEMIEIPCIVQAGSDISSVEAAAATGAEFVGLSSAVFAAGVDPRAAVADANRRLDETAPRFED